jgi:acetyltransferase-like isoleucine patch superfamily enzyme
MNKFIINTFYILKIDRFKRKISDWILYTEIKRISKKYNTNIHFVQQGDGGLTIHSADESNAVFQIDKTSHLKSNTYIECSGGVHIGKYFHTGRGLTIFSSNHNYESLKSIPYDETSINKPVIINDFVWFGSNVTIVPGVEVGEGVVVGSGAVLTKNIPPYSVVGGNPAKILKMRNVEIFTKLKAEKKFY